MEGTHSRFDTNAATREQLDLATGEHRRVVRAILDMANNSLGENSPLIPQQRDESTEVYERPMSVEVHAKIVAAAEQQGIQVPLDAAELSDYMTKTSMESDAYRSLFE